MPAEISEHFQFHVELYEGIESFLSEVKQTNCFLIYSQLSRYTANLVLKVPRYSSVLCRHNLQKVHWLAALGIATVFED